MRRLVGVFVAVVVLCGALSPVFAPGVGLATAAGNHDATMQDSTNATEREGEFTYEELSEPGTQIEGQDPSSRHLGTRGTVFVSYQETNWVKEFSEVDEPEWAIDHVLAPGSVVDTNEVTLHVSRYKNAPPETVHVHIVQFETKQVEVTEGNTTRTKTVAVNQTHRVVEADLSGSGDEITVSLPDTEDPKQATMWVEEYDDPRWADWTHNPVATTNELPFGSSWASFLPWFFTRFLGLLIVGVPLAIGAAIKTLGKMGSGPGKGAVWWIIVPGILAYIAAYMALGEIAGLIVAMPWVMGLSVVLIAYVATLEYADQTFTVLVEQVTTTGDINALGEEVSDIEGEKGAKYHAVELDGSRYAFVKKGSLKKFLLIALTDAEWPVIDLSDMKSRIEYEKGSDSGSKVADAKLYAHESEDEVIDIQWPELSIGLSNLKVSRNELPAGDAVEDGEEPTEPVGSDWSKDKLSSAFMAWSVGAILGGAWLGPGMQAAAVGLIPVAKVASSVTDGWARFVPAPEHATKAKGSRVAEKHELSVAETFEEIQESEADREADLATYILDIVDARSQASRQQIGQLLGVSLNDDSETPPRPSQNVPQSARADGGEPDAD